MNMPKTSPAPALDRGLAILELIASKADGISFNSIVKSLGLPTSSVARFLKVLTYRRYVIKDKHSGLYFIGPVFKTFLEKEPEVELIREIAGTIISSLCNRVKNTALFIYWNNRTLNCLAKELHEDSLAMQNVGETRTDIFGYPWSPFVFRELPAAYREIELKNYHDSDRLCQELDRGWQQYRELGYCYIEDTNIRRFTSPVYNRFQRFCGAIGVGGTKTSIPDRRIREVGDSVKEYAGLMTDQLNDL